MGRLFYFTFYTAESGSATVSFWVEGKRERRCLIPEQTKKKGYCYC